MTITKLAPALWSVRADEADLRVFRDASYTETGLCYSAYLLETGEGYIVLGSLPERYAEAFAEAVGEQAGDRGVSHAVLFGVDGDRASYEALKKRWPGLTLLGGEKTIYDLAPDKAVTIRGDRTLTLGGRTLAFRTLSGKREAPSLYVLDAESGTLFAADAFGADCSVSASKVSELENKSVWLRGAQLYYADIYGSKRRRVMEKAVALAEDKAVTRVCPAFGPVVDAELDALLNIYKTPAPQRSGKRTLAVVYGAGQYLSALAREIAQGAAESGDIDVRRYDLSAVNRETVLRGVSLSDAILFGVPDENSKPVWDVLTSLTPEDCEGKLAAVFHAEGLHSGVPAALRPQLERLGFNLNGGDFFTTGLPTEQELNNALDYGFGFGCLLQGVPNPRKPSLVKCLVCGEIFDASLGVCPVCGVGLDQCVPVDEDAVLYRNDTRRRYLIIGGGIAGVSAAEAIRRRDGTGGITILSAERELPINRPMLTKDLAAVEAAPEALAVHDAAWYKEREIALHPGVTVTAIDTAKKTVTTDTGAVYAYDKLIYAAGAECFMPPFPGRDKAGVLMLRHLSDVQALLERMKRAKRAVVIGGGLIGLEAASELMRAGLSVTVLEAAPQIVGKQLDAESAAFLRAAMEGFGVVCHEGVTIAEITGGEAADGVLLADGRHFPAELVVVSCGIRANIAPAVAAGVAAGRAILVNGRMETSIPDIYACGDCCQFDGVNYQLWQEATAQGRAAGANAAGETVQYANALLGLSLEGFGTSLFAIGDPGKGEGVPYKTVNLTDGVRNRRETYWFFGGALQGAVLVNAPEKIGAIQQAVAARARYEELF